MTWASASKTGMSRCTADPVPSVLDVPEHGAELGDGVAGDAVHHVGVAGDHGVDLVAVGAAHDEHAAGGWHLAAGAHQPALLDEFGDVGEVLGPHGVEVLDRPQVLG